MSTTANDILDVLSNLLPFHLLVKKHRHQAALRLITLPKLHPLHKPIANAAIRYVKKHPTPLHYMMHEYKLHPQKMERIEAARQPNKWVPGFAYRIAQTKDIAGREDMQDRTEIQVYTDGSGLGGKIGASAVLFRGGVEKQQLRFCLGSARKHTVYEGECMGMLLGMELIRQEREVTEVSICVDNQAAILTAAGNKPHPGHYILDEFHRQHRALTKRHHRMAILIRWTPGHCDILGNQAADEAARKATEGDISPQYSLPKFLRDNKLPFSKSAL